MGTPSYWNHNTAFHGELVAAARRRGGRVLDVGCGDGLLLERLAAVAREVVGIDPDPVAVARARSRVGADAWVLGHGLLDDDVRDLGQFDTVCSVATLHHVPLRPALRRLGELVAPGGELRVVGLAATRSAVDRAVSGLQVLPVRVVDAVRGAQGDVGVRVVDPAESLAEVRAAAAELLPGARTRRRLYYRYTLTWARPAA